MRAVFKMPTVPSRGNGIILQIGDKLNDLGSNASQVRRCGLQLPPHASTPAADTAKGDVAMSGVHPSTWMTGAKRRTEGSGLRRASPPCRLGAVTATQQPLTLPAARASRSLARTTHQPLSTLPRAGTLVLASAKFDVLAKFEVQEA